MAAVTGKNDYVSFFIGQVDGGFRAEVKVGNELKEKVLLSFPAAVAWVEEIQKQEREEIENQRNKENT